MPLSDILEADSDADTLSDVPGVIVRRNFSNADTLTNARINDTVTRKIPEDGSVGSEGNGLDTLPVRNLTDLKSSIHRPVRLSKIKVTTPGAAFNPTNALFRVHLGDNANSATATNEYSGQYPQSQDVLENVALRWSSRYNRKGRNSFVVSRRPSTQQGPLPLQSARPVLSRVSRLCKNVVNMFFSFPYWDMAFWSGWAYSWGSILFVIDGVFGWVPLAFPQTNFDGGDSVGLLFFFGALLYEVGATVAYLEAINDGSFHGSAMKRFLEGHEDVTKSMLDQKLHAFFGHLMPGSGKKHKKKQFGRLANPMDIEEDWDPHKLPEKSDSFGRPRRGGIDYGAADTEEGETAEYLPWRWWPTWDNWKSHHVREIGWWACSIQLLGATLYGITGVVALPGLLDSLNHWQMNVAYWVPQIVASCCFLTASLLFTLETQEKWYKPEPKVLGWWVGTWSAIGSMGFLLCGCLGPAYGSTGAQYQSALSSTWGSAAYLISALLQWYEAVNKHPIEELLNEPGAMKSFQIHPV